MQIFLII